eukprot:TRINITY_DN11978_c0_g1_i1.p1 TRINITY_DN11978_c0_g1~~TRINITY_DN11978_c0_g1_i1.p1  ORF type:complete len:155 (-),score=10.79 TRINITY_DN11978_c0_g1_i1:18-482(-)
MIHKSYPRIIDNPERKADAFQQVMSPGRLGETFRGFLRQKPTYLVCGDPTGSPIHFLIIFFIFMMVWIMSVRTTGPTDFSLIDHFIPRGVALIYGGNYTKSSPARSVFINFSFDSLLYIINELVGRKEREFNNSLSSQIFIERITARRPQIHRL